MGNFITPDSPSGDFINSLPAVGQANTMQINVYEITVAGTDIVYFDLYDHYYAKRKARAINAPFSHVSIASFYTPPDVVPEGGATILFLGLSIIGLSLIQSRKFIC